MSERPHSRFQPDHAGHICYCPLHAPDNLGAAMARLRDAVAALKLVKAGGGIRGTHRVIDDCLERIGDPGRSISMNSLEALEKWRAADKRDVDAFNDEFRWSGAPLEAQVSFLRHRLTLTMCAMSRILELIIEERAASNSASTAQGSTE